MPNDEWMKPAEPEAQCTRRVILPARVPTTLTYTQTMVGNARLRGKGCCFDSRGGSRLVRLMRQIEFIGSALDQQGLRSSIKKGIGMLWDWLNARRIVCGNGRSCSSQRFYAENQTIDLEVRVKHPFLSRTRYVYNYQAHSSTFHFYSNNEDFAFTFLLRG